MTEEFALEGGDVFDDDDAKTTVTTTPSKPSKNGLVHVQEIIKVFIHYDTFCYHHFYNNLLLA
jgi:hypothetical protein